MEHNIPLSIKHFDDLVQDCGNSIVNIVSNGVNTVLH